MEPKGEATLTLQVENSQLSVEEGSQLFSPPLQHSELIWERASDTKVLLGWNSSTLVLAFRGTASLSNVFADLKVLLLSIGRSQIWIITSQFLACAIAKMWQAADL